jgi:predicted small metal-binding protein
LTPDIRNPAHGKPFGFARACPALAFEKEIAMTRKYIDCREFPSETNCSVAIVADTESELVEAAVQHAVAVHGHTDTPEFREQIASAIRVGNPPEQVAAPSAA